jgi:hypothetical protein
MTPPLQLGLTGIAPIEPPDAHARKVMTGEFGPWPITDLQREFLRVLVFHQGAQRAIQLRDLMAKLQSKVRPIPTEREIKDAARSLVVDFKVRIGASRQRPAGYYLITNSQEARDAAQAYIAEIKHLAQRVRVLLDPHELAELAGQLRLDRNDDDPKEAA